jgi:hypothetical protein
MFAASAADRDLVRLKEYAMKTIRRLLLVVLAAAVIAGCGVVGCNSVQCAAACTGSLRAGGEIEIPADEPDLFVALCVDDNCKESHLGIDDAGVISCDYEWECDLEELEGGGVRLWLKHSDLAAGIDLEVGDEIHVTVQVEVTGEELVDADIEVTSVSESTVCGSTCTSALALWD